MSATEPHGPHGSMQYIERYIRGARFDSLKGDADDRVARRISELEERIEQIGAEVSFILFLSSVTLATLIAVLIVKATG